MVKEEIGFKHGIPENPAKTWEKKIKGTTFIFKKALEKKGVFLYACQCQAGDTASATSFFSDRDLNPEEIENLAQFTDFISARV